MDTGKALLTKYYNIRQRCYNQKCKKYKSYGAKGVKMCDEWLDDPRSFILWASNNGYKPGLHIHRINNVPLYSPGTCEFLTISAHIMKHHGDYNPIEIVIKAEHQEPFKVNRFGDEGLIKEAARRFVAKDMGAVRGLVQEAGPLDDLGNVSVGAAIPGSVQR